MKKLRRKLEKAWEKILVDPQIKVLGKNVGVPEQPIRLKMHDDHSLDTFILENMNKMS